MKHNKVLDIIGTILLFIGFALAFLPHAFHAEIGLDSGTSHNRHVAIGITMVIIALAILICNNRALRKTKKF